MHAAGFAAEIRARLGRERQRHPIRRRWSLKLKRPGRDAALPTHRPRRHDAVAEEPRPRRSRRQAGLLRPLSSSSSASRTTGSCWRRFKGALGSRTSTSSTESLYRAIPDTTVRLANLRAGELDMLERLAPTDVKSAQGDKSAQGRRAPPISATRASPSTPTIPTPPTSRWARTSGSGRRCRCRSTGRC